MTISKTHTHTVSDRLLAIHNLKHGSNSNNNNNVYIK